MKTLANILLFLCIGLALMGGNAAMMSPMMFDAPGSENNLYLWIAFIATLILPIVSVISIFISLKYISAKDYIKAVLTFILPIINLGVIIFFC